MLYINAKAQADGKLGDLLHDFYCTQASDMHNAYFAKRMKFLKEEREGQIIMCDVMDKLINDEKVETVIRLLSINKLTYMEIARAADVSLEKVLEIANHKSA